MYDLAADPEENRNIGPYEQGLVKTVLGMVDLHLYYLALGKTGQNVPRVRPEASNGDLDHRITRAFRDGYFDSNASRCQTSCAPKLPCPLHHADTCQPHGQNLRQQNATLAVALFLHPLDQLRSKVHFSSVPRLFGSYIPVNDYLTLGAVVFYAQCTLRPRFITSKFNTLPTSLWVFTIW